MTSQLAEQRAAKSFTQEQLAFASDVSRQTIISIEKGRYSPSLPLAFRLAKVLGTTVDQLFGDEAGRGSA